MDASTAPSYCMTRWRRQAVRAAPEGAFETALRATPLSATYRLCAGSKITGRQVTPYLAAVASRLRKGPGGGSGLSLCWPEAGQFGAAAIFVAIAGIAVVADGRNREVS